MDLSIIKKMYEEGNFMVVDSFDNWEDAVKASVQPFIKNKIVLPEYAERVCNMVKEFGPYICICPHIAIPHAMAPELVLSKESHICFMKVNNTVSFSDNANEKAELFFALAAPSGEQHLESLQTLASLLEEEEVVNALLEAKTDSDFRKIFNII